MSEPDRDPAVPQRYRELPREEPPEAWLARIAELRRAGRHAEADESYAGFRRRYPDYRIAEALRKQVLPR